MKRILLIIGGGIAAYKSLDLIRRLRERGIEVRVVMTDAAQRFITPLAVSAIAGNKAYCDLFDTDDELDIGHIRITRDVDLVVVAPATANLIARIASGQGDDLATAALLANERPILLAPAMNPKMWANPATQRNVAVLKGDGMQCIGPNAGEMAEAGEAGVGRMAEPHEIADAVSALLGDNRSKAAGTAPPAVGLSGQHVLITAGPTHEPIDPVRYLANRSSGRQGYAIAAAAQRAGARVTLVSGPTGLEAPTGCKVIQVETANEMLHAVKTALPADIAIFAAAVADWRVKTVAGNKIKKQARKSPAPLQLEENPDVLKTVAQLKSARPRLVVGFAAETQSVKKNAKAKRIAKGCDWIVANDVSPETNVMGGQRNTIHLITENGVESWPEMDKTDVATALIRRVIAEISACQSNG